jgi:hypothetical protein
MTTKTLNGENARELTGDGRENYVKHVGRELGYLPPLKKKKKKTLF